MSPQGPVWSNAHIALMHRTDALKLMAKSNRRSSASLRKRTGLGERAVIALRLDRRRRPRKDLENVRLFERQAAIENQLGLGHKFSP
jgi:hypothetical protein